jgi:hypothetical protein
MTLVLKDRVKEQTTTTGTGTVTLGGAVSGFESFSAVGNGNTTYYAIVHQTADEWEVGLGTYTAAGTLLSRDTILESTNSDAAVNFSAGTKDVFVTYPSDKAIYADGSGNVGIGTSSPASELTVSDGTASGLTPFGGTELFLDSSGDNYLQFGSGTSSSPAIYFGDSADGDVGGIIYAHASNAMSFRTNGSERLRISSAGLVGIGTASPSQKLTVEGTDARIYLTGANTDINMTGTADGQLSLDGNGFGFGIALNSSGANLYTNSASRALILGTDETERMRITGTGNVGIGTTAPGGNLHLQGEAGNQVRLYLTDGDATGTGNSLLISKSGTASFISDRQASSQLWFGTADTERMRIDSSGNVGIGTSSPGNSRLAVLNGGAQAVFSVRDSANGRVQIGTTDYSVSNSLAADLQITNQALSGTVGMTFNVGDATNSGNIYWRSNTSNNTVQIVGNPGNNYLAFATNAAERMRITSSGNVGIGTSSPSSAINGSLKALEISSAVGSAIRATDTAASTNIEIAAGVGSTYVWNTTNTPMKFGTNGAERMQITSSGNVGIGNAAPSYLLDLYKAASTVVRVRNSAATGGTPSTTHGEFVIESTDGNMGMQFLGSTTADQRILFSDTAAASGQIVYNHTSNYMALFTNTAERMRIDSAGNVGIGTSSPANPLHVVGEGTFTRGLELGINGVDATSYITQYRSTVETIIGPLTTRMLFGTVSNHDIAIQTNNAERMRITSAGNVGIGTTSAPSAKLNIQNPLAAGASTNYALRINDSTTNTAGGTNLIGWSHNSNDLTDINVRAALGVTIDGGGAGNLVFRTGGYSSQAERVRIDSSGNVGIGTASPENPMTIQDIAGSTFNRDFSIRNGDATNYHRLTLGYNAGSLASGVPANAQFLLAEKGGGYGTSGGLVLGNSDNAPVIFTTNATERMRIDSSGNVGVGTSSPAKQFEITKASRALIGTLTDGATITPDFDANQNFTVTLGGNRTLANPTNVDAGQTGSIFVVQDATGGRTLSFGANWKFAGGTAPTLSTGANAVDRIDYIVKSSTEIHAVASLNLS